MRPCSTASASARAAVGARSPPHLAVAAPAGASWVLAR